MKESYNSNNKKELTREAIIGLGEESFRKSYYPELQDKLLDLERINVRNKALITTIPDILLVSDKAGHIMPFSLSTKPTNPLLLEILRNNEILDKLREDIKRVIVLRDLVTNNFMLKLGDRVYYFEARLHISEIEEILIIIRDMTDRTLLEMQLREMAECDSLTNLFNRRCFENELSKYEGKEYENLTIFLMDIDGLKVINDTLGHLEGDNYIIIIAQFITQVFKDIGFIARIGGDEFAVIINGLTEREIEEHLGELKRIQSSYNDQIQPLRISLSSGYSYHSSGIVKTLSMFKEADNNMYQNKLLKSASNRNNIVKMLMKALEAKDYITEGHTDRMDELATKIGEALQLPQSQMDRIKLLSKFHDIGKVGIPDSILKKPDKLTPDEWKVMQTHCGIGERIAAESAELNDISHLIFQHHEKWDGTGYPNRLKGANIPIECRILSIVDAYDAMTNDRPYRNAMSIEQAINEIISCSGTQFDPKLVQTFLSIVSKNHMI